MLKKSFLIGAFILMIASISSADVPQLINYQGWLTDVNGTPLNTTVSIQFKIYDSATLGNVKWSETQPNVTVTDGIFNVLLGSVTPIPYSVFDGIDRYLALKVGTDSEMVPRKRLVSVGYSFRAHDSDKLNGIDGSLFVQSVDGVSPDNNGDIDLVEGSNITIAPDGPNNRITISASTSGGGDNLGDHTATENIQLKGNWLSGDGGAEGIYITDDGKVGINKLDPAWDLDVKGKAFAKNNNNNYGYLGGDMVGALGEYNNGNIGHLGAITAGVRGFHNNGNQGYLGHNDYGAYGKHNIGNYGYLGHTNYGAYGSYKNGNFGYLGSLFFGVYGENTTGNYGILGGNYGAYGRHSSGTYGYLGGSDYGVYGAATGANVYAGYFAGRGYFSDEVTAGGIFSDGADLVAGNGGGILVSGGGKIDLMDVNGNGPIISLDPNIRTITTPILKITGGGDLAEPFDIAGSEAIKPGMVVAIDPEHPGQLRVADRAYDRTVAGCVSGANGIRAGLTMQQEGTEADGSIPVALSGRVYCRADASYGSIQPGDLLTTSDTPGHAMKVTDYTRAQGTILGKAMTSLENGRGLVLVLVTLQ